MTDEDCARLALDVARKARPAGNHPFGAILVGPVGSVLPDSSVLMESGSTRGDTGDTGDRTGDRTGHAERVLMTKASPAHDAGFLSRCTTAASAEPYAMRAGAACWAGFGRVVHGLSERALKDLIGPHPDNVTMDLPCHVVLAAGQHRIEVAGPLHEAECLTVHEGFRR